MRERAGGAQSFAPATGDEVETVTEILRRCMTGVMTLADPLKVDVGVGHNWLEAH